MIAAPSPQTLKGSKNAVVFAAGAVALALGENGAVERAGLQRQTVQAEYAQRWATTIGRAIEDRRSGDQRTHLLLLGADAGTGKTVGYGLPALMFAANYGLRVAVATNSHHLQRQMLGDDKHPGDLALVNSMLADMGLRQLKIAQRFGQQAFISAYAVNKLIEDLQASDAAAHEALDDRLALLQAWAEASVYRENSGLLEDARLIFDDGELPVPAAEICLGSDSPKTDWDCYNEHVANSERADVVLMTHHYAASCALYRPKASGFKFDILIIDEADRLVGTAQSVFGQTASLRRMIDVAADVGGAVGAHAIQSAHALGQLARKLSAAYKSPRVLATCSLAPYESKRLIALARNTKKAFNAASRKFKGREKGRALTDMANTLGKFAANERHDFFMAAVSFSPSKNYPSINFIPENCGAILRRLWRKGTSENGPLAILFTSATLAVPGAARSDSERLKQAAFHLGVPFQTTDKEVVDTALWKNFEPVKFGAVRFILADPSLPKPVLWINNEDSAEFDPRWIAYLATTVQAAHTAGGRTLVLVGSYKEGALLGQALNAANLRVIVQTQAHGGMKQAQSDFVAGNASIWISPTAWEGLSLPGLIKNLVISRLPLRPVDELERSLLEQRSRLEKSSIEGVLQARSMNAAKQKFKQGFGRAIRSRDDKARIWIADPRFTLPPEVVRRNPSAFKFSSVRSYAGFHDVIPRRFQVALREASVLMETGQFIR